MRIAVVGAGIGGAAVCRFLRQLERELQESKREKLITIDVYESTDIVGGRLRTESIASTYSKQSYEVGGAVIHKTNHYMTQFCDELGLERVFDTESDTLLLAGGEYNASLILRTSNRWPTILTLARRYGFDLLRLYFALRRQISKLFCSIYTKQQDLLCCDDVIQLLDLFTPSEADKTSAYSFQQQCCRTFRDQLSSYGNFSRHFVDEIAQAAARVNYGQSVDELHGFVGLISLAGAQDNSLWHVQGGNDRVAQELLRKYASKVLLNHRVQAVHFSPSTGLSQLIICTGEESSTFAEYDCVVIACPLSVRNAIKFENSDSFQPLFDNLTPFEYRHIVTTLVGSAATPIDARFNGLPVREVDSTIFLIPSARNAANSLNLPFNSIGVINPVNKVFNWWQTLLRWLRECRTSDAKGGEKHDKVRKIFSPAAFKVDDYFSSCNSAVDSVAVDWHAYPQYEPIRKWFAAYYSKTSSDNQTLPPTVKFKLTPSVDQRGLYYINAIETLGSAMEMSAIGAKNVALLVKRDYKL